MDRAGGAAEAEESVRSLSYGCSVPVYGTVDATVRRRARSLNRDGAPRDDRTNPIPAGAPYRRES